MISDWQYYLTYGIAAFVYIMAITSKSEIKWMGYLILFVIFMQSTSILRVQDTQVTLEAQNNIIIKQNDILLKQNDTVLEQNTLTHDMIDDKPQISLMSPKYHKA